MSTQISTKIIPQQEQYVYFVASGCRENGKRMSHEVFAGKIGVSRKTLYLWQERIPNFWELVQTIRTKFYKLKIDNVYDAVYKQAIKGDVQAAKLLFQQLGDLKPMPKTDLEERPTQIILKMGSE